MELGWDAGSVAEQAVRFARNMVLTRLLAPSAFGAMAIVMSSSAIVGALTDVGERSGGNSKPEGPRECIPQRWLVDGDGPVRFSSTSLFLRWRPWVSRFYGNRRTMSALLRVALLSTLFDGAMSPRSILTQKEMKLGRWMVISNGGGICGVIADGGSQFVIFVMCGPSPLALQ